MIKVLVEGHGYRHDLFELIRVFFITSEVEFIDEYHEEIEGLFINSSLVNLDGKRLARAKLFSNGQLIKEAEVSIDKIYIKGLEDRKIEKNAIKKSIYDLLIDQVGYEIPWGILTGIRPIKVAHDMLNNYSGGKEIKEILTNHYRIDGKKAQLMIDIAQTQRKHIYPLDENKYSLYIGIPFCPSRCSYCSFPAFATGNNYSRVDAYVNNLIEEIKAIKKMMEGKWLNTVYIGGGTPTSIRPSDLERIIVTVLDSFKDEDIREFTVEAGRPDTLDSQVLSMLRSLDIDRISINPQTMNSDTLRRIGRNHDINSFLDSYYRAKDLGFKIINVDIILGLPGERIEDVAYSLNEIGKLEPENLTVHTLALKRGSKLFNQDIADGSDQVQRMLELSEMKAADLGMIPYYLYRQKQMLGNLENIGYSKPGKESVYNISMMEEKETIIGAGVGAVSKIYYPKENRIKRVPNFKDINEYNKRIEELINKKRLQI